MVKKKHLVQNLCEGKKWKSYILDYLVSTGRGETHDRAFRCTRTLKSIDIRF